MTAEEIFEMMNQNPVMHLATLENGQPRVRGALLYRADKNGIIFHTGEVKELYGQLKKNPKAEVCFQANGVQIRASGEFEEVHDSALKEEIFNAPSRQFLREWSKQGFTSDMLRVFCMKDAVALTWTMEDNFKKKEYISLG